MKREVFVPCMILALLLSAFGPSIVQAETPIEVRVICMPHDAIADSRTSLQPQAQFAINRLSGEATNGAGLPFSEVSNILPNGVVSVPVPAAAVSRDRDNSITKLSFSIVSVASHTEPTEPAGPLFVVIAVPAGHTGELSIQYTRYQGAGWDQPSIVAVSNAGAPHPGMNEAAVLPPASLVHSEQ